MGLGGGGDLVEQVERSANIRFRVSIGTMVLTALAIAFLISRNMSLGQHELKDMLQIVGTSVVGNGIVVGLLTGKALASIAALNSHDNDVGELKMQHEKKLKNLNDFSVLLVLLGTFASGYSVTLG